jgi:hypothetical protein
MQVLRQSTQIIVRVGPFVDVTDGFTPETGITLGAADEAEALKANGAATVDISAATWAAITGADGWYNLTLTTALTDTVGCLDIVVHDDSVCLPVFARFQVIEEAAYDAIYAASAAPATAAGVSAVETDTQDIQGRLPAALVSGRIDASAGALAANVITAAATAADFGAEIADAVWDEDATGHQTQGTFGQAIGDPVADTNTIYKAVVTDATGATVGVDVVAVKAETAVIVADTNELQTDWANGGRLDVILDARASQASVDTVDANVDAILVDTGTTLQAELDGIQATVDAILLDTAEIGAAGAGLTALATQTSVNTVDTVVDAILADTGTDGVVVAAASKTGYALSAAGVDAVLDEVVEGAYTFRELLRGIAAATLAKASGLETTTAVFRDLGDTKPRITATVDADGNRTAVTLDLT